MEPVEFWGVTCLNLSRLNTVEHRAILSFLKFSDIGPADPI